MPEILNVALPAFDRVTVCAGVVPPSDWVPKERVRGTRPADDPVPIPVRPTDCGLLGALSVNVSVAFLVPMALGVKVTLIVQLAFGATDGWQLSVSEKSAAFVPEI